MTIYQLIREYDGYYYAQVLSTRSNRPTTMSGYESPAELHVAIKEQYGPDATRVPKRVFQEELEKRATHTPEMIALLNQYSEFCKQDVTTCYVYGSACRLLHAYDCDIPSAMFAHTESGSGYYTYVVVPEMLDRDVIENYELTFVSGPAK